MHHLDEAYERVYGAREHLDTLQPLIRDFAQQVGNGVSLDYKMGISPIAGRRRRVPFGQSSSVTVPAPLRVRRLIADVVENLRSALNYMVYQLACFDAKAIVENTQFVVVDCEKDFKAQMWHLRGLTAEHIAAIKRLQPFEGCQWTKRLINFSNPTKPETFTVINSPVIVKIDSRVTKTILAGGHVDVNDYATIKITFSDGTPVIESLDQLAVMVVQTLDAFKPEFERN